MSALADAGRPVRRALRNPFVAASVVVALIWPAFAPDYWIFDVTGAIPLAVAGLGLLVLQGWARELSLASAGLYGSSMYLFGWLNRPDNQGQHLPWVPAAALVVLGSAGLMALVAGLTLRLPAIYVIVVSLGLQSTLEKLVFAPGRFSGGISGGTELGIPISNPRPYVPLLNLHTDTHFYFFSMFWLAVVMVLVLRLRHSPAGQATQLVGADRQAAAAIGVPVLRQRVAAFATCGALIGFGGVLSSWLFVNPPVFTNYLAPESLLLLAIPVLAGRDAIAWVLLVAVVFQVVPLALESWEINTFLLAGIGLAVGTAAGSRGIGGIAADLMGAARRRPAPQLSREEALTVMHAWLPAGQDEPVALQLQDVRVRIGATDVLAGASLSVPAGALVGLIGPNGAGKSTLFDVVCGLRPADSGRVEILGIDAAELPAWRRARLGLVRSFQTSRIVEDLTVAENLLIGAGRQARLPTRHYLAGSRYACAEANQAAEAVRAVAVLLGIGHLLDRRAGELEFSARRRVDIGRAVLAGPRVLLLDEPAAGLDPHSTTALISLIRDLHRDLGLTVLLVEHHVTDVLATCSLIHVLADGQVIASAGRAEILADARVREVYLGDDVAAYSTP